MENQLQERMFLRSPEAKAIHLWKNSQGVFGVYDIGSGTTQMVILFDDGKLWLGDRMNRHFYTTTIDDAKTLARFSGAIEIGENTIVYESDGFRVVQEGRHFFPEEYDEEQETFVRLQTPEGHIIICEELAYAISYELDDF